MNLAGGIAAWQGHATAGSADTGMLLLKGNESPQEIIALSYGLESGLQKFYASAGEQVDDPEVGKILAKLAEIEIRHKQRLFELYQTVDSESGSLETFEAAVESEMIEGGFSLDFLIEHHLPFFKTPANVLNFAMMLEAQAMDLYMRYADWSEHERVKEILFKMADEEKAHLKSLGDLMEKHA